MKNNEIRIMKDNDGYYFSIEQEGMARVIYGIGTQAKVWKTLNGVIKFIKSKPQFADFKIINLTK